MKVTLFGATGRVGKEILNFLLKDGYRVTILSRTPEKVDISSPNLTVNIGDATEYENVEQTIKGSDAVISALGTDGKQTLSIATPHLIKAMQTHRVERVLTIGTAGILQSRIEPDLYRFQSSESRRKTTRAAEEHLRVYKLFNESTLKWTIVCPTYLPDGNLTKIYRVSPDFLPPDGKEISVQDTAHFTYLQLEKDQFVQKRVGICY